LILIVCGAFMRGVDSGEYETREPSSGFLN
jgi:hypothetical protein